MTESEFFRKKWVPIGVRSLDPDSPVGELYTHHESDEDKKRKELGVLKKTKTRI